MWLIIQCRFGTMGSHQSSEACEVNEAQGSRPTAREGGDRGADVVPGQQVPSTRERVESSVRGGLHVHVLAGEVDRWARRGSGGAILGGGRSAQIAEVVLLHCAGRWLQHERGM